MGALNTSGQDAGPRWGWSVLGIDLPVCENKREVDCGNFDVRGLTLNKT